ncbi:hypothetical protein J6590_081755 [Homalodisca vitripennis]|nr:hypothetical protein J6590_081755 [Homalodisca vitripennis]
MLQVKFGESCRSAAELHHVCCVLWAAAEELCSAVSTHSAPPLGLSCYSIFDCCCGTTSLNIGFVFAVTEEVLQARYSYRCQPPTQFTQRMVRRDISVTVAEYFLAYTMGCWGKCVYVVTS